MKLGDTVEVLNGKYRGRRGTISHVYPNPYYLKVRLGPGEVIDRNTGSVKLVNDETDRIMRAT